MPQLVAYRALNGALGYVHGFLGLFVPFGIWNFEGVLENIAGVGLLSVLLWFVVIFGFDTILSRLGVVSSVKKVVLILIILLLLTVCVDVIFYGDWRSWSWFIHAEEVDFVFSGNSGAFN